MKRYLLLIALLFLSSCGENAVECIEPDDWGNTLQETITSKPDTILPDPSDKKLQVVPWQQSYMLDGSQVVMVVKNPTSQVIVSKFKDDPLLNCAQQFDKSSTWTPLFGSTADLGKKLCTFPNNLSKDNKPWAVGPSYSNVPAINMPCSFYMGIGLYASIGKLDASVGASTSAPAADSLGCGSGLKDSCFFHVGDNACVNPTQATCNQGVHGKIPYFDQQCPAGGLTFQPSSDCNDGGCNIYFKILDRYYDDNAGAYTVEFKSGVKRIGSKGLITGFVSMVQAILCDVSYKVYNGLVQETDYLSYIRALLILYITCIGLGVMMDMIQMSHKDLMIRVLKIALIIQISTASSSWEFFNKNVFQFFTQGVGEITGVMFGQGAAATQGVHATLPGNLDNELTRDHNGCGIQNLAGFQAFDDIITQLFSKATWAKVASLIPWRIYGILYAIVIYMLFFLVMIIIVKAILIYVVSYLAISLLIVLAPIFIPFILFEYTKQFYDNWLKYLVSYFIQPLIILTFAFFVTQILVYQLHYLVGYRVCWKKFMEIPVINVPIYFWQYDFNYDTRCILTPNEVLKVDGMDKDGNKKVQGQVSIEDKTDSGVKKTTDTPDRPVATMGNLGIATYPGNGGERLKAYKDCGPENDYSALQLTRNAEGNAITCTPYVCPQTRYLGFPYLDLDLDNDRIVQLTRMTTPDPDPNHVGLQPDPLLIDVKDIVLFAMIIGFMWEFNKVVPKIAKQLGDTSMSQASISDAGAGMYKPISMARKAVTDRIGGAIVRAAKRAVGNSKTSRAELSTGNAQVRDNAQGMGVAPPGARQPLGARPPLGAQSPQSSGSGGSSAGAKGASTAAAGQGRGDVGQANSSLAPNAADMAARNIGVRPGESSKKEDAKNLEKDPMKLGNMYSEGSGGVARNAFKAEEYYKEALEKDPNNKDVKEKLTKSSNEVKEAQNMYDRAKLGKEDEALALFEKAARSGHKASMAEAADIYNTMESKTADVDKKAEYLKKAQEWREKAAESSTPARENASRGGVKDQ